VHSLGVNCVNIFVTDITLVAVLTVHPRSMHSSLHGIRLGLQVNRLWGQSLIMDPYNAAHEGWDSRLAVLFECPEMW